MIYANQLLRSEFPAMKHTAESILRHHRALEVDDALMPFKEIITLIDRDIKIKGRISIMERKILLNPGPATTTDTVKQAQIVPDICPRETEFVEIMKEIRNDLVKIVHGDLETYTSVLFCGSGTICMDVCLNSLLKADGKILIVNNGAYSSRAAEICEYYHLPYIDLRFAFDELPDCHKIEEVLKEHKEISLVYTTHNETGTGILNPIRQIGALAHQYGAIFVVDTTFDICHAADRY